MVAVSSALERYRTVSTLGSGGMATVVLAEDQVLGRQVALKRLTVAGDVRGLSRLRREALIGASLSHRNLVSIYDIVATEDGEQVIVMEYIPGETLSEALNREGKLPAPEALRVLENVGAALDAIHGQGIVHRDVKPANILLGTDGTVKLADLGIASVSDRTRITTTGAILGSFRYMAPEQLDNQKSTSAIDIYALSAVSFEVLSGHKARGEANPLALAHAIATQPPPDLLEAWPQAPSDAAQVLRRGMSRDPALRPSSASELTGRLRAALLPESTVQFPGPVPPPAVQIPAPVPPPAVQIPAPVPPPAAPVPPPAAPVPVPAPPVIAARQPTPPPRRPPPPPVQVSPRSRFSSPPDPAAARSRRGPLVAALLALLAAAVVLAVVLSGGSSPKPSTASAPPRSKPGARRTHAPARKTSVAAGTAGAAGAGAAATSNAAGSSGSAASGSSSGTTTSASQPSSSGSSSSAVASPPASTSGASPVSSVESFYTLAASHRYPEAWALADPSFRNQLGGYQSFQAGQAGDRSITFDSAKVVSQTGNSATVAVQTTSVRTDGTKHCAGTVDMQRSSAPTAWLLHLIHINCG